MKQMTFADAEYAGKRKQTRKELFLIEMDQVVPWKGLLALIEPHYPKGEGGRPAYPLMAMLRVHLMQNWFGYSDPAMEEALYETTILRQFAGLSLERIPDETTILNFRRLLEKHELAAGILGVINGYLGDRGLSLRQGTIVDATLIHAPSSTKNKDGKRDPEMHQTKKGNQYYFGMKAHIGVDVESGLVHSVVGTAANVADVTQVDKLLHGQENMVAADAGYIGVEKRPEHEGREVIWQIAARRSTYKKLGKSNPLYKAKRKIEKAKAQVRAKVEHPFRVIKKQFGHVKTRFRGLAKNTAQLMTLFALSNLWMARGHLLTRFCTKSTVVGTAACKPA
ncbi:IS5 family transposase [Pseudomonas sp. Z8(2022)]|uniref:IS5 family transposase n=1 Tax=Pseudomonas sp. Z8(2022) TaxID=2962597 RepID=UPI0021F4F9C8|nr:IS5 family transposase [Pseudomonas sp. Z8(2022)]UYP30948.1 IS5 family transposase [Pseudomonas sp. Z8(2022)]